MCVPFTTVDFVQNFGYGGLGVPGSQLSIDVSVHVQGADGPAKVVFTELGAVSNGCSIKNLGAVFTGYSHLLLLSLVLYLHRNHQVYQGWGKGGMGYL